ncbi:MAG: acetylornithine/succinylornithine family transaminase [Negativicutes bacterium]|nr:acetylornithine/succinylornithine family transaminase [Negativicutes bacterium]
MNKNSLSDTRELLAEAKRSILFTTVRPEVVMEKGEGLYLWDTDGKKYLDFVGGWAVTSLGHSPAVIAKALARQSKVLVNASPSFLNIPMIEYARLLVNRSCFDRVFFASSGAEANEGAIKLARKYGSLYRDGAFEIITTVNSFHGRTLATMSATGKKKWKNLFEPKVPGFIHVPLNDFAALKAAVNSRTCAVMLEPIQGEGGVFEVDFDYIRQLRQLCDEQGILLIFDEVQTGLARTGKLFAYQHYGVEPDVMTLAKGIGGGFPLAALLVKERFNIFEAGDQGGTYSGQPLAMAVGLAVMQEVLEKNLVDNAAMQGEYIQKKLRELAARFQLTNIRGKGLLLAFDLPTEQGAEVVAACLRQGLLVNSPQPATIRLMPALIVNTAEIDWMTEILANVLQEVLG